MRQERDGWGELKVFGLRYRSFVPSWGLHPGLGAQTPVQLLMRHRRDTADYVVTLHEWHPDNIAYAGLPEDLTAASQRRAERITLEVLPRDFALVPQSAPDHGLSPFCLDLRCFSC
jgi:uncharacterized protein (DUF2126 family)